MTQRQRSLMFDYNNLSLFGKVSLWFGNNIILSSMIPGKWLDVLSGYRSLLQKSQIKNKKYELFSLDFKLDKSLKESGINIKESKIRNRLPYISGKFNNVTMVNGLEHLEMNQKILVEMFRVLKKDGILQIIVPTWFGKRFLEIYAFKIGNKQAYIEMNDHKMYYDEKTLWPMLVKAGFKPHNIYMKRIKFYCSLYARAIKE